MTENTKDAVDPWDVPFTPRDWIENLNALEKDIANHQASQPDDHVSLADDCFLDSWPKVRDYIATLEAEVERLRVDAEVRESMLKHLRIQFDGCYARVAELEEALRPLAEMAGGGPEWRRHSDRARALLNREET